MLRRRALTGLLGLVFILGISAGAFAQKTTGDINGTVTDATGAVRALQDVSLTRTAFFVARRVHHKKAPRDADLRCREADSAGQ